MSRLLLRLNPEFQRHVWQEFSPIKVIAITLISIVAIGAAAAWDWHFGGHSNPEISKILPWKGIETVCSAGIMIFLVLWGSRLATDAIPAEVRNNSWDLLRLTAMRPISLALGKFFGATSFVWYASSLFILPYLFATNFDWFGLSRLLMTGLVAQAVAMMSGVLLMRMQVTRRKVQVILAQVMAIVVAFTTRPKIGETFEYATEYGRYTGRPISKFFHEKMLWLNEAVNLQEIMFLLQGFIIFWCLTGLWRAVRQQMQHPSYPIWWLGFTASLILFLNSFSIKEFELLPYAARSYFDTLWMTVIPLIPLLFVTYAGAFFDIKNHARLAFLGRAFKDRSLSAIFKFMPLFIIPLLAVIILASIAMITSNRMIDELFIFKLPAAQQYLDPETLALLPAGLALFVLFMLRDIAMLYAFVLSPKVQWSHMATIVTMLLLYGILPLVAYALDFNKALLIFYPRPDLGVDISFAAIGIQLAIIGFWLFRLRRHYLNYADEAQNIRSTKATAES